jgi:hypothetical protein
MFKKFDELPVCIKKRFAQIILIFILVIALTLYICVKTKQAGGLLIGAVACLLFGYIFAGGYRKVLKSSYCTFEGTYVGMELRESIFNMPGQIISNRHKYILQNEKTTIEIITYETLHMVKKQKYRFYLPDDIFNNTKGKQIITVRQYYGFELEGQQVFLLPKIILS